MRQCIIDGIRNDYKCMVYVDKMEPKDAIALLSRRYGIEIKKITSITKACNF
jgi:hypothetical protein